MMKKGMANKVLALVLTLMLALMPGMSLAEAQYGELTQTAVTSAWNAGREITATLGLQLSALAGDGLDDEDSQMVVQAISELLEGASISVSLAKTADGVHAGVEARLQNQSVVTAAADIGAELITLQTSVLPGKQIVVRTEQLLQVLGAELPSAEEMTAAGNALAEYIDSAKKRYGDVVTEWVKGLEPVKGEAQAATDTCDAAAYTVNITITGEQLVALCEGLLDAAMQDETLIEFIQGLGLTDDDGEPLDMRAEMEEAKQELAEEELPGFGMEVNMGMNEKDEPVSAHYEVTHADYPNDKIAVDTQSKTAEDGTVTVLTHMEMAEGGETLCTYDFAVATSAVDETETNTNVSGTMFMEEDGMTMSMDIAAEGTTKMTETAESMNVVENVLMTMMEGVEEPETDVMRMSVEISHETAVTGEDFTMGFSTATDIEANIENEQMTIGYGVNVALSSAAYEPVTEELEQVDLFALDQEGLEALALELQTGATQVMFTAIGLLPPQLLSMMLSSGAAQ